MNFNFEKQFLLILVVIPILFLIGRFKKMGQNADTLSNIGFIKNEKSRFSYLRLEKYRTLVLVLSMCLLVLALMKPVGNPQEIEGFKVRQDMIILLDVSRSMLSRDIIPNRLERAKELIVNLVDNLNGERVGLVIFSGKASLKSPLTSDYFFYKKTLESITPDSVVMGGSDINAAIKTVSEILLSSTENNEEQVNRNIILISDGDNLGDDPLVIAKELGEKGVIINTISVGTAEGGKIPVDENSSEYITYNGKEVRSVPDRQTLTKIADITGGVYIPADKTSIDMSLLYQNFFSITANDTTENSGIAKIWTQYYKYFLFFALLIIIVEPLLFSWLK